jgi:hypothetical protein
MTVQRLITLAFFDLGAIQSGETPNTDELNDSLDVLNGMLGAFSNEQLTVFNRVVQSFPGAGLSSFTLGTGGIWNTGSARAQKIVGWRATNGAYNSGGAPLSLADFDAAAQDASVRFAGVQAQISALLAPFFQSPTLALSSAQAPLLLGADSAWPLINVRVFPATTATIELAYWTPITAFVALTDVISLPPGFEELLRTNLAVRLSPQYGRSGGIDPVLAANAQNAKAAIQALNTPSAAAPAAADSQPQVQLQQ